MLYIFEDYVNGDLFTKEFNNKEEAVEVAAYEWGCLSTHDKNRREDFYVLKSVNPDEEAPNHHDGDFVKIWKLNGKEFNLETEHLFAAGYRYSDLEKIVHEYYLSKEEGEEVCDRLLIYEFEEAARDLLSERDDLELELEDIVTDATCEELRLCVGNCEERPDLAKFGYVPKVNIKDFAEMIVDRII